MVPLGPLPGACWTPLISLLLVYCLLPPGEASKPGEGWSWGLVEDGGTEKVVVRCQYSLNSDLMGAHQCPGKLWGLNSAFRAPKEPVLGYDLSSPQLSLVLCTLDLCLHSSHCWGHSSLHWELLDYPLHCKPLFSPLLIVTACNFILLVSLRWFYL